MPKIRGVKPDYWTDEAIVDLTIPARLLLIGLWNYACDNGHLQDKPKQIKMRIFPGDDVNATQLLRELEASGRIVRGGGWITVPNLTHHQKPDRRYFTTCDKEGCEDPPEKVSQRASRRVHTVHTPSAQGVHDVGTECARADGDGEGDGEGEGELKVIVKPSSDKSNTIDRFNEFWDTYGHKVDRRGSEVKWRLALRKPGVTADLLITAAAAYVLYERQHNEGGRFIMGPAKWLLNERWRDERPAPQVPRTNTQQHFDLAQRLAERTGATVHEIGGPR